MSTKLVDSIVQIVQSLSKEEQQELINRLNALMQTVAAATSSAQEAEPEKQLDGWDVFLSLGDDAVEGKLENPSINHDRYLYQQPK
ncbi:hypothetical protein BST81_10560 [Leptolyngbya sp. 'hensonii']|uniref:hypothetical protein n=1 Tax=Leptolyngbya sp. 'hensonii' TaxID=1922337 RepID=UPI00094FFE2B|nr:hypothetical protein [Leptolyngbya sp. 'hensonii']OLP18512.1 hypothetical protein BST81_10560 [Leptolyngbya sp. 'hensonii']